MKLVHFLLFLFAPLQLFSQIQNVVSWNVTPEKTSYQAGDVVKIRFNATIETGWHLYALDSPLPSKAVKITVKEQPPHITGGTFTQTGVKRGFDPNFEIDVSYFEDKANIVGTFGLAENAPKGTSKLDGEILYMTCNDRMCLPPKKIPFSVNLNIVEKKAIVPLPTTPANPSVPQTDTTKQALTKPTETPLQISWQKEVANSSVAPSGLVQANFVAQINPEWKLSTKTEYQPFIQFSAGSLFSLSGASKMNDNNISFMFKVAENAAEGAQNIEGNLFYTVCTQLDTTESCQKKEEPFNLSVNISKKQGATVIPAKTNAPTATTALNEAKSGGLLGFLLLAIGAALIALLTPCVFPMIPLTVSYFTKHTENPTKMALVYGAAIVATFTGLGLLMSLISGAAGAQTIAANPYVNLFIGLVFIVFAFSLLGFFNLELPSSLVNYFNQQGNSRKGYVGVLFMGFTLTLVSFTCTVPFVGGLLAATTQGEWFYPILGMLAFSTTFALPFVLFAMFPKWLSSLPKSGSWMQTVKVTLGFIELAAALKFLSNADLVWGTNWLSRSLAILICVLIFMLCAVYLFGKLRLPHDFSPEKVGAPRAIWGVASLVLASIFAFGINGNSLGILDAYLPPEMQTTSVPNSIQNAKSEGELAWFANQGTPENIAREMAFKEAKSSKKPIFIDFTGYTCTNCRQMEANVFPEKEIEKRFKHDFVLLRLFTDDENEGPTLQEYQLGLTGTVALPTYAIVSPDGKLLKQHSGLASTADFARFLDEGKNRE